MLIHLPYKSSYNSLVIEDLERQNRIASLKINLFNLLKFFGTEGPMGHARLAPGRRGQAECAYPGAPIGAL